MFPFAAILWTSQDALNTYFRNVEPLSLHAKNICFCIRFKVLVGLWHYSKVWRVTVIVLIYFHSVQLSVWTLQPLSLCNSRAIFNLENCGYSQSLSSNCALSCKIGAICKQCLLRWKLQYKYLSNVSNSKNAKNILFFSQVWSLVQTYIIFYFLRWLK